MMRSVRTCLMFLLSITLFATNSAMQNNVLRTTKRIRVKDDDGMYIVDVRRRSFSAPPFGFSSSEAHGHIRENRKVFADELAESVRTILFRVTLFEKHLKLPEGWFLDSNFNKCYPEFVQYGEVERAVQRVYRQVYGITS